MGTTVLYSISKVYVLEFHTNFYSLTKIVAAWRSDSSTSVSLLASQALELLLLQSPPWGLLWDGNSQPQLEWSNTKEKERKCNFPKST